MSKRANPDYARLRQIKRGSIFEIMLIEKMKKQIAALETALAAKDIEIEKLREAIPEPPCLGNGDGPTIQEQLQAAAAREKECLKYCLETPDIMWAAKIMGILLDCDFKDAKDRGLECLQQK